MTDPIAPPQLKARDQLIADNLQAFMHNVVEHLSSMFYDYVMAEIQKAGSKTVSLEPWPGQIEANVVTRLVVVLEDGRRGFAEMRYQKEGATVMRYETTLSWRDPE